MNRMLKELISWALLCAFVMGISAQTVTKNDEGNLVFPPIPETCEYKVTEQLNQTPKSATFGNIATGVIHTIAPVSFQGYVEVIRSIAKNPNEFTQDPTQLGTFFVGIAILTILGLILAMIVPCIGCIFCCCRCCDNCGGKRLQKTEDNTLCRRCLFAFILFAISLVLGVGCASVYLGGTTLVGSAETLTNTVVDTTDDLECYISQSISEQFEFLVNISITAVVDLALEEVDGISSNVEVLLQDAEQAVDTVKRLDAITREVNSSLNELTAIQDAEESLRMSLEDFVNAYNTTLNSNDCGNSEMCMAARQNFNGDDFVLNSDVTTVVNLNSIQSTLANILAQNLTGKAEELSKQLEPIMEFIADNNFDTPDFNSEDFSSGLTDNYTAAVKETFDMIRSAIQDPTVTEIVGQVSQNGFIGAAIFAALIGIIVVFYILGIIFGEIGRNIDDEPTNRDCMANCGGCMLVFGWVLSLLFYFTIAILAAFFFLFGGLGEKFICQPLSDLDNLNTIQELLLQEVPLETSGVNLSSISFATALRNCEENQGIWSAFNLDGLLGEDFDALFSTFRNDLDLTSIIGDFNFSEALDFDVDPLKDLTNLNFNVIDFNALQDELSKPFPSLNQQIMNIRDLSGLVGGDPLQTQLLMHADDLQTIQEDELQPLQEKVNNLEMELPALEQNITDLQDDASQLVTDVEQLLQNANTTLKDVEALIPTITNFVNQTLNHVEMEIKTNVGRCRPLYNLYDSIDYIMCDNIFDSLNSIWLGFGIAVIFFIFGVIFAVKLSKFYRVMLHPDKSNYDEQREPQGYANGQYQDPYAGKNYPV